MTVRDGHEGYKSGGIKKGGHIIETPNKIVNNGKFRQAVDG